MNAPYFFLSDQTGVTAETLGHSLITQFESQGYRQVTLPFIDSEDKAREAVRKIDESGASRYVSPYRIFYARAAGFAQDRQRGEWPASRYI